MIGVNIDLTERKQSEEALRGAEKLAAAGRMAATIAHEINNPLEAVTNLLYLLTLQPTLDEAREYIGMASPNWQGLPTSRGKPWLFIAISTRIAPFRIQDVLDNAARTVRPSYGT